MPISMSSVWDESIALIKRERHLMLPLALATIGVGSAASEMMQPAMPGAPTSAVGALGMIAGLFLNVIGSLALTALALTPGISVGDSLRLGVARLPKILGIVVIFVLATFVMMIPLILTLGASGITEKVDFSALPPIALFIALVIGAVIIYLGARLLTINALVVDSNPPIIDTIKASFAATQGIAGKIVGVILLFLVVTIVVGGAAAAIFGLLFGMIGKAIGAPLLGKVLVALINGLVSALLSIVSTVFVAMLYRKLSAE